MKTVEQIMEAIEYRKFEQSELADLKEMLRIMNLRLGGHGRLKREIARCIAHLENSTRT